MQEDGGGAEVTDGHASRAQRGRWVGAPGVQQQVDTAYDVEGRAGRSPRDHRLITLSGDQLGQFGGRLVGGEGRREKFGHDAEHSRTPGGFPHQSEVDQTFESDLIALRCFRLGDEGM
jgi:hypothetical protein